MPSNVATALFTAFVLGLLWLERKDTPKADRPSHAIWIPIVWLLIMGSRMVTQWSKGFAIAPDTDAEGSSMDRNVFLALIIVAAIVVMRRRVKWREWFRTNRSLVIYFSVLLISVAWSDQSFSSFKRWIKDLGNVIMVVLILTEVNPNVAIRTVLARSTFILVAASVLFIKYIPQFGRYYDAITGRPTYGGVATNKNMLGIVLFMGGVYIAWRLLELYDRKDVRRNRYLWGANVLVLIMIVWLLKVADSATAIVCLLFGVSLLVAMRFTWVRRNARRLVPGLAILIFVGYIANSVFGLAEMGARMLGRNLTLTDRTKIWSLVLAERTNPLIGTGFYSFWAGERQKRISENFSFTLNSSHNSYLETYLNNGVIGAILLLVFLGKIIKRACRDVALVGDSYSRLRLAYLMGNALYGMTEALFDRLSPVWFVVLLCGIVMPRPRPKVAATQRTVAAQLAPPAPVPVLPAAPRTPGAVLPP